MGSARRKGDFFSPPYNNVASNTPRITVLFQRMGRLYLLHSDLTAHYSILILKPHRHINREIKFLDA